MTGAVRVKHPPVDLERVNGPADMVSLLDDDDIPARVGEPARGDKSVVAAPDDDGVDGLRRPKAAAAGGLGAGHRVNPSVGRCRRRRSHPPYPLRRPPLRPRVPRCGKATPAPPSEEFEGFEGVAVAA